jgi:hypothetical protein
MSGSTPAASTTINAKQETSNRNSIYHYCQHLIARLRSAAVKCGTQPDEAVRLSSACIVDEQRLQQ